MKASVKKLLLLTAALLLLALACIAYSNNRTLAYLSDEALQAQFLKTVEKWAAKEPKITAIELTEVQSDETLMDPMQNARSWTNVFVNVQATVSADLSEEDLQHSFQSLYDSLQKSRNGFRMRLLTASFQNAEGEMLCTMDSSSGDLFYWQEPPQMRKAELSEAESLLQTVFYDMIHPAPFTPQDLQKYDLKQGVISFAFDSDNKTASVVLGIQVKQKQEGSSYHYSEDFGNIFFDTMAHNHPELQNILNTIDLTILVQEDGGQISAHTYQYDFS